MTVRCWCDICAKVAATLETEIPEGRLAIPESWLRLELKTKFKGSVMTYSTLLCEECRIAIERDLNEDIIKKIEPTPIQCRSCKHMITESDSSDDGRFSVTIEECECADDPRMGYVDAYILASTPEEREECPCYEPRGKDRWSSGGVGIAAPKWFGIPTLTVMRYSTTGLLMVS